MLGTQRTSLRTKDLEGDGKVVEPVWVIESLVSSPIIISSEPSYSECREIFFRPIVTWWKAPESTSQLVVEPSCAAKWARGDWANLG